MPTIKIKKLRPNATIPTYATDGSACFDLYSNKQMLIKPGETASIPTGLAFEIPEGYVLKIYPRSGISVKTHLRTPHSVGIVDSDYRGEITVPMYHAYSPVPRQYDSHHQIYKLDGTAYHDSSMSAQPVFTYIINEGDRVAQAMLEKVITVDFEEVNELSATGRGTGGFGSTGTGKT